MAENRITQHSVEVIYGTLATAIASQLAVEVLSDRRSVFALSQLAIEVLHAPATESDHICQCCGDAEEILAVAEAAEEVEMLAESADAVDVTAEDSDEPLYESCGDTPVESPSFDVDDEVQPWSD